MKRTNKESFKVTLPGSLYCKNGRWWWKVKLPGESKTRARGLKPEGSRYATTDRDQAEDIARGLWESAIRSLVRAEAEAEADQKVKAMKKRLAEVEAESTETVTRTKAEVLEMIARAKAECEEKLRLCNARIADAEQRLQAESIKRAEAEELAKAQSQRRAEAEMKLQELLSRASQTGKCDCCGKTGLAQTDLSRIDSGHLLCPECLAALRAGR